MVLVIDTIAVTGSTELRTVNDAIDAEPRRGVRCVTLEKIIKLYSISEDDEKSGMSLATDGSRVQ